MYEHIANAGSPSKGSASVSCEAKAGECMAMARCIDRSNDLPVWRLLRRTEPRFL